MITFASICFVNAADEPHATSFFARHHHLANQSHGRSACLEIEVTSAAYIQANPQASVPSFPKHRLMCLKKTFTGLWQYFGLVYSDGSSKGASRAGCIRVEEGVTLWLR